jgi:hypothetical protein
MRALQNLSQALRRPKALPAEFPSRLRGVWVRRYGIMGKCNFPASSGCFCRYVRTMEK